jgi:hypothetical protein
MAKRKIVPIYLDQGYTGLIESSGAKVGFSAAETSKRGLVVLYDDSSLLHALILCYVYSNDEASEHRSELDPPVTESNLAATNQLDQTR